MNIQDRVTIASRIVLLLSITLPSAAIAQSYPVKPIRLVMSV